jgi:TfoX/Sxy family transcriptional regulator of competence genes
MSTRPETLDFLLDQLGNLPGLRTRRMFGEYCVYVDDKPVAFVCDDQLYVKPTAAGEALLPKPLWGRFYDKAKPHLLLTPDRWDERELLRTLLLTTADALPRPRPPRARGAVVKSARVGAPPPAGSPQPKAASRAFGVKTTKPPKVPK